MEWYEVIIIILGITVPTTGLITFFATRKAITRKHAFQEGKRESGIDKDIKTLIDSVSKLENRLDQSNISDIKTSVELNKLEISNIKRWQETHDKKQGDTFDRMFTELKEIRKDIKGIPINK